SYRIVAGLTEYRLVIPIDSADGLYAGSDVLIAGARAGTVRDIRLDGSQALVTIGLDDAHAPVHSDAQVAVRPKSLLGEKYVALDPGGSGNMLSSGSTMPRRQVARAVDLQDVVNSLDQPTREKLRTLVLELGGGLSGQGTALNQTFSSGRRDLDDLAAIANTLAARDADLEQVIQGLDQVTAELARSDRSQQLGGLIQNSQTLLASLAQQDAQIKTALVEANAALQRNDTALQGTAGALNGIFVQAPQLMSLTNELTADLANGMANNVAGRHLTQFDDSMRATRVVFDLVTQMAGDFNLTGAYHLRAMFQTATDLVPGVDVTMSGIRLGKVESLHPSSSGVEVLLTLRGDGTPVYEDARAVIREKNL